MNKVVLMGRLTKDPDVRYTQAQESLCIARYTLAVDRRGSKEADFVNIVAFGKAGEFTEKYLHKGMKIALSGRIQTGSFTNKDGVKVYTTEVVAEDQEFAESKKDGAQNTTTQGSSPDGFIDIPEGIEEDLPFSQP